MTGKKLVQVFSFLAATFLLSACGTSAKKGSSADAVAKHPDGNSYGIDDPVVERMSERFARTTK